ncbi:inositol monophosphatase [Intrasporangium oryzae NRRL B-24470]|uniref:Inositol monophosphatase n=1 Tax=Intrasporangium oryzae NRRL B-24470 TaxID=1386089 RepID=W9GHF0_9MICO|nr:inositol monophosphatase [Intrasporangium oryzae]EWT03319.1 inositol monophosphatase [Intrasporangium oryzae NRRL B-24470]
MHTEEVLTLLKDVAAEVITPRFRALADGEIHEKNPGDLVTVADHEAEVLITRALTAAYPDAVVLGEEAHSADPSLMARYAAAEHAFTVDPVDGTKNFVHGSADHAVMMSETRGGEAVRAWIWQPQHEAAWVAERGAGAFRNGERVTRQAPGDVAALRGRTSRRSWIGQSLAGLEPMALTWVSCGIDYPKIVEGEADYILYRGAAPWDHVPGSLILSEAGGLVGTLDGQPYRPRDTAPRGLLAAASPAAYDVVCRSLASSAHLR